MLIMDVDGVLTDGKIILSGRGDETKNFSVYDGVAVSLGRRQGLKFALITARKSEVTSLRARELGIEDVFQVEGEKLPAYEALLEKHGLEDSEAAYIGDDIHDVEIMKRAGLSAAPPNASSPASAAAHYITRARGGDGAVREVVDLILKSKGRMLSLKAAAVLLCAVLLYACSRPGGVGPVSPPADGNAEIEDAEAGEKVEGGFRYTSTERGRVVLEIEGESAAGLGAGAPAILIEEPRVKWHREEEIVLAGGSSGVFERGKHDFLFEGDAWADYGPTGEITADRIKFVSDESRLEAEGSVKGIFYFDMNSGRLQNED